MNSFKFVPMLTTTAFDKVIISDPPFETVIHTASPFQ